MMNIYDTGSEQNCMIGIALQPYKTVNGTFLRFIKADRVLMHIENMKDMLQLSEFKSNRKDIETEPDFPEEQRKRRKLDESC